VLGCSRLGGVQLINVAILATILTTGSVGGVVTAGAGSVVGVSPVVGAPLAGAPDAGPGYRAPLPTIRVLTPFTPPPERYGAGHLGVDLAAPSGAAVLAAGSGVVGFAGPVAGRGVVVLLHPDGISTEYEPLAVAVAAGQRVVAGQRIGSVTGTHRGCAPATCLHWGARRGTAYLDPLSLLAPLGVVRLLPWD
jgi:murein DD-endopeptidase MepM/ murein hydrolase activator NlpD